ncbi:glycosyltransferase family 4 protein [uncultured Algibacter sp.]|uniref:glycosyltransferase family 4 protein n=1 Tax=uncultured Algibacter sp. TaxID=298659 RepID=UPI0026121773|nr:glycosyltransferase family 4 protein [uncultured Algibacter sp.]
MKKLLIIGFVWPEPRSSAAGSRMLQLVAVFQSAGYQITFATPCAKSDNAVNLEENNIEQVSIELNNSSFDDFIKVLNPDIVMFDRFMMEEQFGWRVTEHCPKALKILDTEDLHCLRKGRRQAFKEAKPFDTKYLFNDTAKREIASIYRCDLSLIISEVEMEILKNDFKVDASLLLYVPFLLDNITDEQLNKQPFFNDRKHFITIGNFLHEPNYNAVLYLKETIWPLIREDLPHTELHVYGSYASLKVNQLHNEKQGFLIKGFAEDANVVMQNARVCLAPIRFGAGLKGKLIDAMRNGTPCVMSSIAAEGMFGKLKPNGFIEDNHILFSEKAIQLYKEENGWVEKQQNGFQIVNSRFNKTEFQVGLMSKIVETIQQLTQKRFNNFTGLMLQHNSLQSTKYMSKWIEEKNKKK